MQNISHFVIEAVAVFNLKVDDFHTYFVGQNGVLVHNTECGDAKKTESGAAVDGADAGTPSESGKTSSINNKVTDPLIGNEVGRFIADDHGNIMIDTVGGKTVAVGRNGLDTHTLYPNGSNYQRYNPVGHGINKTPHGHGHLMGNGPGKSGQGASIDVFGNVVPFNSPDAHWIIH